MKQRNIDCKYAEKLISGYINKKLSLEDKNLLINHIRKCKSCKEELTIQYLVFEGFSDAGESKNYNLITRLEDELKTAELMLEEKQRRNMFLGCCAVLILCFIMFVVFVLLV